MSKKHRGISFKAMLKFFNVREKHGFNDDENQLNSLNFKTKNYDSGTYKLNKRGYKIGASLSIDLGFEKKKLE